jgi:aldose 1-epimerase
MPDGSSDPLQSACYPLVPFSSRISEGRFAWQGQDVQLPPMPPAAPHALHGFGWRALWTVEERSETRTTFAWLHKGGDWPWSFEARQTFALTPRAFVMTLSVNNLDKTPMPLGLGLHPHFPGTPTLEISAEGLWTADYDDPIPQRLVPFDGTLPDPVDHCLTGWSGEAVLRWPDRIVRLTATPPLGHLHIYAPRGRAFLCAEPVSHAPDALNRAPAEMIALAPGETVSASARIEVLPPR